MSKKLVSLFTIFILLIFLVGCAHFGTGISPSSTPVRSECRILGHATGESSYFVLLFGFPFGEPDYAAAIQDAISKVGGGDALINVSSYQTFVFLLVGYKVYINVEGDVVKK
ncbi:MAG: hypothetical protein SVZ03_03880 [Spirochaetota bacterium]|nr:hypothetical protein [Spirochaetota bacterium]